MQAAIQQSIRMYFRYDQTGVWSQSFSLPAGRYLILSRLPVDFNCNESVLNQVTDHILTLTRVNTCRIKMSSTAIATLEYAVIAEIPDKETLPRAFGFSGYNATPVTWAIAATAVAVTNAQVFEVGAPTPTPVVAFIDNIIAIRSSGATLPAVVLRNRVIHLNIADSGATAFFNIHNPIAANPNIVASFSFHAELKKPLLVPANFRLIVTGNSDGVNADNLFVAIKGRYLA